MSVTFVHPIRHTIIQDAGDAIKCDAFFLGAVGARRTIIYVVIQHEHKRVAHRSKAYQLQKGSPSHWRVSPAHTHTRRHVLFIVLPGLIYFSCTEHICIKMGTFCPSKCLISKTIRWILNWVDSESFHEFIVC